MSVRLAFVAAIAAVAVLSSASFAQSPARPKDAAAIRGCAEKYRENVDEGERRCVFALVSDPCAKRPSAQSDASRAECFRAEQAIWDELFNENFRTLREDLDDEQKAKLRDMQRAWIAYRNTTCEFYYHKIQGYDVDHDDGGLPHARDRAPRAAARFFQRVVTAAPTSTPGPDRGIRPDPTRSNRRANLMQFVEANGARIPALGLGTMTLKGDVCVTAVSTALKQGYRHLDTAERYGNEAEVGEGLRASGVDRERGVRHHQGLSGQARAGRFRAVVRRKPAEAQIAVGRSPADPLAQSERAARRHHAGAVQGQDGRPRPPYRHRQFHPAADRGGGAARRPSRWSPTRSRCIPFSTRAR